MVRVGFVEREAKRSRKLPITPFAVSTSLAERDLHFSDTKLLQRSREDVGDGMAFVASTHNGYITD